MLYHRELHLPITAQLPLLVDSTYKTLTQIVDTTRLTNDLIQSNTEKSFTEADKYYNRQAVVPKFAVNDHVLLYDEHVPQGTMRKLHCFSRPVTIVESLPHFCYKLRDVKTGKILPFKIQASRLKALTADTGLTSSQSQPEVPDIASNGTEHTNAQVEVHQRTGSIHASLLSKATERSGQQQQQQPESSTHQDAEAPSSAWEPITRIIRRRRHSSGRYQYLVQWAADSSTSWLFAYDIDAALVRHFNARFRRRRL